MDRVHGSGRGDCAPMQATRPDGTAVDLPKILVANGGERNRFLPDNKRLIYSQGDTRSQDFSGLWT
jgi:hypothetical protein